MHLTYFDFALQIQESAECMCVLANIKTPMILSRTTARWRTKDTHLRTGTTLDLRRHYILPSTKTVERWNGCGRTGRRGPRWHQGVLWVTTGGVVGVGGRELSRETETWARVISMARTQQVRYFSGTFMLRY